MLVSRYRSHLEICGVSLENFWCSTFKLSQVLHDSLSPDLFSTKAENALGNF